MNGWVRKMARRGEEGEGKEGQVVFRCERDGEGGNRKACGRKIIDIIKRKLEEKEEWIQRGR